MGGISSGAEECRGPEVAPLLAALQAGRQGRGVALFLDYDGTLVPIAPRPEEARPDGELLALLTRLAAMPGVQLVVVSGRGLKELMALLPVPGLHYVGSHGGEAWLQGRPLALAGVRLEAGERRRLREELQTRLAGLTGWWLEEKPLGFALHFRQADPATEKRLFHILAPWLARVEEGGLFTVLRGKKVLEVLPRGVSKGKAMEAVLGSPEFSMSFPIYCGDDVTDESAFEVVAGRGLTVRVGHRRGDTAASHTLSDPASLRRFLTCLRKELEVPQ